MENKRWEFVDNQNANFDGLNDAGIETFSANRIKSLVREVGQNAIDAKREDIDAPVRLVFDYFKIQREEFPGNEQFIEILNKCKNCSRDNSITKKFFENAIKVFSNEITVLRISDFNTTGLRGAKSGLRGTDWHNLVKERGSSNKDLKSGGSFGIGKAAPIGCSDIRTVIYSSLDCQDNIRSYIGVSQLISFERETDKWTVGRGYYTDKDNMNAILDEFSLNGYRREEPGTDIYILGFLNDEQFNDKIIEAVIENFLVSIWNEKLIVQFGDMVITKDTLGSYVDKLNLEEFSDIHNYYFLLTHTNTKIRTIDLDKEVFGKKYGFSDGECKLLLMEGDELNKRILMTRSAGMKLFEQDRIHSSISFTGILMITGEKMNKMFKEMEMPSHDSWEPGRCRENSKEYTACYRDLRTYLRNQVKQHFGRDEGTEVEAFGVDNLLYVMEQDSGNKIEEVLKCKTIEVSQIIKTPLDKSSIGPKEIIEKHKKTNSNKGPNVNSNGDNGDEDGDFGSGAESVNETEGGNGGSNPGSGSGTKGGQSVGEENHGIEPNLSEEKEKKYKPVAVKMRMFSVNSDSGKYLIKFIAPKKSKSGKLEFILSGEQSTDIPDLTNVEFKNKNIVVDKLEGNTLCFSSSKLLKEIELEVEFNFKQYCMWEVRYYESKK